MIFNCLEHAKFFKKFRFSLKTNWIRPSREKKDKWIKHLHTLVRSGRQQIGQAARLSGRGYGWGHRHRNQWGSSSLVFVLPPAGSHAHLLRHRKAVGEDARGLRHVYGLVTQRHAGGRWKHLSNTGVSVYMLVVRWDCAHGRAGVCDNRGRGLWLAGGISVSETGCRVRVFLNDLSVERRLLRVRGHAGRQVQRGMEVTDVFCCVTFELGIWGFSTGVEGHVGV